MNSTGRDDDTARGAEPEARWLVLIDSDRSDGSAGPPPPEAMIGGWPLREDGSALAFEPNPDYRPSSSGSPTDPVDAATRMVVAGRTDGQAVLWALRDSIVWLAVDDSGAPEVDAAPDGMPCVLVTTSGLHRERIDGPLWREVTGAQLAALLPEHTDVMVNLGGPAAMRLIGDVVRAAMTSAPDD